MKATCTVTPIPNNDPSKPKESAFTIDAEATASGVSPVTSTVSVQGRIVGQQVKVDYTYHSQ